MKPIKVIDAYPPHDTRIRPRCESKLSRYVVERNREWRARMAAPEKRRMEKGVAVDECGNFARYTINGKCYCRKHGALVALDLVAEEIKR